MSQIKELLEEYDNFVESTATLLTKSDLQSFALNDMKHEVDLLHVELTRQAKVIKRQSDEIIRLNKDLQARQQQEIDKLCEVGKEISAQAKVVQLKLEVRIDSLVVVVRIKSRKNIRLMS